MSGAIGATGGSAVALVGTFLPWLRSGARDRSSYTIFDLVERLGFAPGGVVAWSLRLWPLVPLLLVAVTVSAWAVVTRHLRWSITMGVAVVALVWVGGTAIALVIAPDVGLFRIGIGPAVTLVGVLVAVAGVVTLRRRGSACAAAS
jgi:hypothetical protein